MILVNPGGTLVQSCPRRLLVPVCLLVLLLHSLAFALCTLLAPTLFHSAEYQGSSCREPRTAQSPTWYGDRVSSGTCAPLGKEDQAPLGSVVASYRFPREEDEVSSYSTWNWRLVGSLLLDVTFYGKDNIPVDDGSAPADGAGVDADQSTNHSAVLAKGYDVSRQSIPIGLRARLNLARNSNSNFGGKNGSGWETEVSALADRELRCTVSQSRNDSRQLAQLENTAQYICILTPLLDLQLPSNGTYILSLSFSGITNGHDNSSSAPTLGPTFFNSPAVIKSQLTLVLENRAYHQTLFYLRCLFTPFLLTSLVWFCLRMYLNDLYIGIPDRILVSAAVAQIIHNGPLELLVLHWPSAYWKVAEDLLHLAVLCCLLLFWVVYAKDKLARNEAWERNTRYYAGPIVAIVLCVGLATGFELYIRVPTFENALQSQWQTPDICLAFTFGLALLALVYQTYLSILVFRAICEVSTHQHQGHPVDIVARQSPGRIRLVLFYCLVVALLTMGGLILRLAITLSLNWNPQFYLEAVPFHLDHASGILLGLYAMWNIHIITLLLLLSRVSHNYNKEYYVNPVKYNQQVSTTASTSPEEEKCLDYQVYQEPPSPQVQYHGYQEPQSHHTQYQGFQEPHHHRHHYDHQLSDPLPYSDSEDSEESVNDHFRLESPEEMMYLWELQHPRPQKYILAESSPSLPELLVT